MRTSSFAFGTLIALISCLTGVSCSGFGNLSSTSTTTSPTPTPTFPWPVCFTYTNHCSIQANLKAVCSGGYCVCTSQGYDYYTCLPDAYGCKIVLNTAATLGKPQYNQQSQPTFSCTPVNSSTQYEVHVLSVYKVDAVSRYPPTAGDASATVNIVSHGKSDRPIILVLGSYDAVNWILNIPADITISKVILVAYWLDESSVSGDVNQVQAVERKRYPAEWPRGYGNDSVDGDTVGLLKQVNNRFGVVTSFTGTYIADRWSLMLSNSSSPGSGFGNPSTTATTTATLPAYISMLHRQKCYIYTFFNSSYEYCPFSGDGNLKAVCSDGYCVCTGQGYDYYTCLPDAYGCKIAVNTTEALAKPQYNSQQPQTTYSCTPVKSSTRFEVHVLSVHEDIKRRPPVAGYATVNFVSDGKSDRPIILVLGSYEPVNWILNLPADITITKVILIAYYIDQSSVGGDLNQVQAIERNRYPAEWPRGYGNDSVGGDTVGLLKQVYDRLGVVTSFTGTYKANEWSLMLSSARRPSTGASTGPSTGQSTPTTPVRSEVGPVNNTRAQSSACVSAYKTGDKLSGFMIVTIMITVIQYAW